MMKQRIIVMNGQRLLQTHDNGQWNVTKVEKAGSNYEPGVYNLYLAEPADKAQQYAGLILHTDKEFVYQQQGDEVVRHARSDFGITPDHGTLRSISYDEHSRAKVMTITGTLSRGMTRS
jgi:hypothetical protein